MSESERLVMHRIVTFGALGGFAFMALTSWMLAFDVASIATLIADNAKNDILAALIIGGAITKGTVVGGTVAMASLPPETSKPRMTRVRPSVAGL